MIRLLCWAVFIVFLCAVTPAMAVELPDRGLTSHIGSFPLVYKGECKVDSMKIVSVDCKIFYDEEHDVVWLCLYDKKERLTHIIAVKNKKEQVVWTRRDLMT